MKKHKSKETAAAPDFPVKENEFINHILNSSRAMLSVINRDYQYVKVNSRFCYAHASDPGDIIGKTLGEVWGEETFNTKIRQNIDRCFQGVTVRYEATFNTPNTSKRYYEVTFSPLAETGPVKYLLAETLDVTDLRQTEKNVIRKEEEFRQLETNLPIGFIRCLPDGTILHCNRAYLLIMNCPDDHSLTEHNLREFYTESELFDVHIEKLFKDFKPKGFGRVSLRNCIGSEIVCRISGFVNFDETGKPSYIDFAFEDSTHEMMLENRLLEAKKLETIGSLAGGIAHDFNNILATISGYTELLLDDLPKNSESADHVGRIRNAVSKAQSLTNQILTFSRQVEQEKVPVNIYEVLTETVGFVKAASPSTVNISCECSECNKYVFADPTQLFRVFLNLLTNAVQSLENNEGTITVVLGCEKGESVRKKLDKSIVADEYVVIRFTDTGRGMDPSLMRRIFEPFFTTREVGQGSGLGLSVVHGIITEMSGEIMVTSRIGSGSTFSIYLPVTSERTDQQKTGTEGRRLLLITGNRHESRIISIALESAGYALSQASQPEQLTGLLSNQEKLPEVIVFMSDSEKISLKELGEAFRLRHVSPPCIIIGDSNDENPEEDLSGTGIISQLLVKPVSLKEIETAIQLSIK